MGNRTTIYLADLANDAFGISPATVPLGIGYLKSYAEKTFPGELSIRLFRTFKELNQGIVEEKPDLVGCAWYGWNRALTVNALEHIKTRYSDIVTLVGGANAPKTPKGALQDLKEFRAIDVIIPNEGEIPFANTIGAYLERGKKKLFDDPIDGTFFLGKDDSLVAGEKLARPRELDMFPSPYLDGNLDQFLSHDLMPLLQASRGCPYACVFCVSANPDWNKLRAFSLERVEEEVLYLERHAKNRVIRMADENFGILKHDLEIAQILSRLKKTSGYPSGLRVYTHKVVNDRIKEMSLLLRDLIPMNISFQTLTPEVLKNIDRKNVDLSKVREDLAWAHENNVNGSTELIFGLPGESVRSFLKVIDELVSARMDSIVIGTLWMLKETPLEEPAWVEKHGYRIMHSVAELGYTKFDGFENIEIDKYAVASKSYSYDEFVWMRTFSLIFQLFMFRGYFKEVVYIWENYNVKVIDVISRLIDHPSSYPVVGKCIEKYKNAIDNSLFEKPEEAITSFKKQLEENNRQGGTFEGLGSVYSLSLILAGELISPEKQSDFIDEVIKASYSVFETLGKSSEEIANFSDEMGFAKKLVKKLIVPYWELPEELEVLSSPYDISSWCARNYEGRLSDYRLSQPKEYRYQLASINMFREFNERNNDLPYFRQSENFFKTFRTNYGRRYLAVDEGDSHLATKVVSNQVLDRSVVRSVGSIADNE